MIHYTAWRNGRLERRRIAVIGQSDLAAWAGLALVAVALVLMSGCGAAPPPRTIAASPDLPESVLIAASRARDAWCAAPVGWCPELVPDSGDAVITVGDYDGSDATENASGGRNDGSGSLEIATWAVSIPLEDLVGIMTHEFGHFGIDGHVNHRGSLMYWRFEYSSDIPHDVDSWSSVEWCDQQGC
jgi:hypothetical protein